MKIAITIILIAIATWILGFMFLDRYTSQDKPPVPTCKQLSYMQNYPVERCKE